MAGNVLTSPDPARLYQLLLNTGLQTKDNPLHQVIHSLIGHIISTNKAVSTVVASISGSSSGGSVGPQGIQGLPGIAGIDGESFSESIIFPASFNDLITLFTQGSVIFTGPGGRLAQDNLKLFWDDTSFRLGIGTGTPGLTLDVRGPGIFQNATAFLKVDADGSAPNPAAGDIVANRGGVSPASGVIFFGNAAAHYIFYDGTKFIITDTINGPTAKTFFGPITVTAGSGDNKNAYFTGTIFSATPAAFYFDTALTGLSGGGAQGMYLGISFSLGGNLIDADVVQIPVTTLTLNGHTLTNATSLDIQGTPTNGTNKRALWVRAGLAEFDGIVSFGGNTSSFPALKNSSTTLQVRLADNSADAPISMSSFTHSAAEIDKTYQIYAPVTGGTVTMSAGQSRAIINPLAGLALLTVTLPPTPVDGQVTRFSFTQIITGLTVNAPGGATVVAPPTTAAVDSAFEFLYQASSTSWFPA